GDQQGFPFGYDENTIENAPGYPGKIGAAFAYSQLNRRTVLALDRPQFLVTYSQTSLLLAEAAYRGYISGDASAYYQEGIAANMEQMESYSGNGVSINITPKEVQAYLQQVKILFDPAQALEQIN